jgi:hypothetical protein
VSARERNAARYRLEEGLEFWHERWVMAGPVVLCGTCQASQFAHEAADPFVHVEGCAKTSDFAKYPWRELRELLRDLPTEPT